MLDMYLGIEKSRHSFVDRARMQLQCVHNNSNRTMNIGDDVSIYEHNFVQFMQIVLFRKMSIIEQQMLYFGTLFWTNVPIFVFIH